MSVGYRMDKQEVGKGKELDRQVLGYSCNRILCSEENQQTKVTCNNFDWFHKQCWMKKAG